MENVKVSQKRVKELSEGAPKQGFVEIRLKDPKKTGTITVREYKDERGQDRPFVDQHGHHRILKISKTLYLDMTNEDDRLTLQQVANHPIYIKGSGKSLVVVNHEAAAAKVVDNKDLEARAMGIIQKLEGEDLKDFSRVLLIKIPAELIAKSGGPYCSVAALIDCLTSSATVILVVKNKQPAWLFLALSAKVFCCSSVILKSSIVTLAPCFK